MFTHLHVHSDYSPMRGVSSLAALCEAARQQGAESLALTDRNGLYGAVRFLSVARQHGLRPILGAELTQGAHRALLLIKDKEGYANLCRLLSARHAEGHFDPVAAVSRYRRGLIVLSDDAEALRAWQAQASDDLYVELTPGPSMQAALAFSRQRRLPPAATNRVHFVAPQDFALHRLLRAIALTTTLSRLTLEDCCAATNWLMPPARMEQHFPHVPEALANTERIARACQADWWSTTTVFPRFAGQTDPQALALLRDKTYAGAARRYGRPLGDRVAARIEHELKVIRDTGFAHYFLVVEEIVRQAPRTCGRGSVAASIVAYCLEITHVDPIRHNLFFERFLTPHRKDPPDIDIDFPWDERDAILQWIFDRHGKRNAAMVANQNRLGLRSAFREVAKVYGMPPAEIGDLAGRLAKHPQSMESDEAPLDEARLAQLGRTLKLRRPWPEIIRAALLVQDHLRNLALHCGGLVIVPDEIRRYVPVEPSAKGPPVIQWEKDQTEEAGLVKIDILGNRSLSVIRDALDAVAQNTGRRIDYAAWDPIGDPATRDVITKGDTMGCFYIESPATRLLLRKLWRGMPAHLLPERDVFDYLVMVSSLVRPASLPFVDEFLRRAQGAPGRSWHPDLDELLKETHGIMTYQEDVTKVAMKIGHFSLEDAEQLRKVLSKKHKQRQLRDYQRQFVEGAAAHGLQHETIKEIWDMIMSFTGYSFCKPHSASYAQVSFKSAWLRVHYPAEFMAAVISNAGGFYSTFAYLSEARRMGLAILPPDINASEWPYRGHGKEVRVGFMSIKTLSRAFVDRALADRRAQGPFRSFHDFLGRVSGDLDQVRALIRAGCFDGIAGELTRPALLWRLYVQPRPSAHRKECPLTSHASRLTSSVAAPIPPEYSAGQRLRHEIESFGFPLSRHPLELCPLPAGRYVAAADMARHVGRRITMRGWFITDKIVQTKHGEPMDFVSFEDLTGLYEATFFPDAYRRFAYLLAANRGYLLRGVVEEDFGTVMLTVQQVELLDSGGRRGQRGQVALPPGSSGDRPWSARSSPRAEKHGPI